MKSANHFHQLQTTSTRSGVSIEAMSHEDALQNNGYDICSPITGSMKPMIRPRRDSVLFVPLIGRATKYDLVLYRRHDKYIMHRIIRVLPEGYLIRGDNGYLKELVLEHQLIGVMQGFYRDERYIERTVLSYRLYASIWPRLHPLIMIYKSVRRFISRTRRALKHRFHKC